MKEQKRGGRPGIVQTQDGIDIKLPPSFPRDEALRLPTIPSGLSQVGGIFWLHFWKHHGDTVDPRNYYIVELLASKYQTLKEIKTTIALNNVPYLFTHSNKSKTEHPIHRMAREAEKDYLQLLKEMGFTPASFASIASTEKIDETDPISIAVKEMAEMSRERAQTIEALLELSKGEEDNANDD